MNVENGLVQCYLDYLQSKEWQKIKKAVLDRDKHVCVECRAGNWQPFLTVRGERHTPDDQILNVHHKTYLNLFREQDHLDDLETLCREHHELKHSAACLKRGSKRMEPELHLLNRLINQRVADKLAESNKGREHVIPADKPNQLEVKSKRMAEVEWSA